MGRVKKQDHAELVDFLGSMSLNRFLNTVMEANEQQGKHLDRFVAEAVARDLQAHLTANGIQVACPECGSIAVVKNGKRGEIQRYKCRDCGERFTAFTGTLLEKSNYTWAVWVEVIRGMLVGTSLEQTRKTLIDDYHCVKMSLNTVWLMRMKVMYAIYHIPSPTLTGTIQFDDTFLREDQKGSRHLVNPLPSDVNETREPRYGYVPSQLGSKSNEFATITTGIDNTGHCVCRVLACGPVPEGVLYDFVKDHTEDIAYACSDADETYTKVFRQMNVAHYQRPSKYYDIIKKAGYKRPIKRKRNDDEEVDEIAKREWGRDYRILEHLWEEGAIDRILNRGRMTFDEFQHLKQDHGLNLGRVNSLHNQIKEQLERDTRGVSTKYLPYYIAWFEFVVNRKADLGTKTLASRKDAEDILVEAIKTRKNITVSDLLAIREAPLAIPQASGRYIHLLEKNTAEARRVLNDPYFLFGDEDIMSTFNVQTIVWDQPLVKLRELAQRLGVKGWGSLKRTPLANRILEQPTSEVKKHLLAIALNKQGEYLGGVRRQEIYSQYNYSNMRPCLPSTFTDEMFCLPSDTKGREVIFLSLEWTGSRIDYDEVLRLAIMDWQGVLLYDSLFCPAHRNRWKNMEEHHITPAMVSDKPTIVSEKGLIEAILNEHDVICGWNMAKQLRMLYAEGIDIPMRLDGFCDLMRPFCEHHATLDPKYKRKTATLLFATDKWQIEYEDHNSASAVNALWQIWGDLTFKR